MKIALIAFNEIDLKQLRERFADSGLDIASVQILSSTDDIGFKRGYESFRDTADALIVADGASFDLKQAVAEFSDLTLCENENARKTLEEQGYNDFSGAMIPSEATLIPNESGEYQAFLIEDRDFSLFVLPKENNEFCSVCEKYVIPYLAAKIGIERRAVFKCFGYKSDAENLLNAVKEKYDFGFAVRDDNCDLTVSVLFGAVNDMEYRVSIREIYSAIKDICYADYNVSLSETLFTLLKLGNRKIAVAESFTGGKVAGEIVKNAGSSAFLTESIVAYSNESKVRRLLVPEEELKSYGAVSSKVAYRMAAGLFKSSAPDIAVATTGIAGPNGDGTGVPVGRCFVAVGTKNGIHTYKFDFTGNREEITDKGVNAALFFAVKTIKNM